MCTFFNCVMFSFGEKNWRNILAGDGGAAVASSNSRPPGARGNVEQSVIRTNIEEFEEFNDGWHEVLG